MRSPAPRHLPGLAAHEAAPPRQAEPSPQQVARVWEELDAAAGLWRRAGLGAQVERLAAASAALRRNGPGTWRDALCRTTGLSPAGVDAAWDATFAPHDAASLHAAAAAVADRAAKAPRRVVHVLPSNVFPATVLVLVRGWLLGAAQWLRPSERETAFAAAVAALLHEVDAGLARTFAVCGWPHRNSRIEASVLGAAEVVTAQGTDAAVAALGRRVGRSAPAARFLGFGWRWSLAVVSREAQSAATAAGLAWDLSLFDQRGCLSPSLVLAERTPDLASWVERLAGEMAEVETRLPSGRASPEVHAGLRTWRETMRVDGALDRVRALHESNAGTAWAVALLDRCRASISPGYRHVAVAPFASLCEVAEALGDARHRIQGLVAALDGWDAERRAELVTLLRPTRVAPPGEIQLAPAGWPQDHLPALGAFFGDGPAFSA